MTLPDGLTAKEITLLVEKSRLDRTELDKVVIEKLSEVEHIEAELDQTKMEVEIHRRLETTRREMEREMKEIDDEIKVLEAKKRDKKSAYEEKLHNLTVVYIHLLCITRTNLPFRN